MKLKIKKLIDEATLPSYSHKTDAGLDLYSSGSYILPPGRSIRQIKTGIAIEIPDGYVGLIWDKSGLSQKHGLKILGGVIDSSYRGEIMVGITNLGTSEYIFHTGEKVAQMLIQKVEHAEIEEVENLDETERGEKGFGSTGR